MNQHRKFTIICNQSIMQAMLANELQHSATNFRDIANAKVVRVLQRLIDHIAIRKCGLPTMKLHGNKSVLTTPSCFMKVGRLLYDIVRDNHIIYLREMNSYARNCRNFGKHRKCNPSKHFARLQQQCIRIQ